MAATTASRRTGTWAGWGPGSATVGSPDVGVGQATAPPGWFGRSLPPGHQAFDRMSPRADKRWKRAEKGLGHLGDREAASGRTRPLGGVVVVGWNRWWVVVVGVGEAVTELTGRSSRSRPG